MSKFEAIIVSVVNDFSEMIIPIYLRNNFKQTKTSVLSITIDYDYTNDITELRISFPINGKKSLFWVTPLEKWFRLRIEQNDFHSKNDFRFQVSFFDKLKKERF